MGDLRGGLVDLGPMHGVTDFTFKLSDSAWSPPGGLWHGRVTSARVRPAAVAPRVGPGLGLVV